MTDRCGAETFDGTDARQCTRTASSERDGLPVCWQHAKLTTIQPYGGTRWRVTPKPEQPRTADGILAEFRLAHRFALYATVGRIHRLWQLPDGVLSRGRARSQRDEDAIVAEYRGAVREVAIRAAFALQDLGLGDDEIVGRMREVVAPA
jgi:hypothetical protein